MLNIREVILPDSVKKISDRAFFNGNFTKINIENIQSIGEDAFAFCHLLKLICEMLKKLGTVLFMTALN